MNPNQLSVLKARGQYSANKIIDLEESDNDKSYGKARHFTRETATFENLEQCYEYLTQLNQQRNKLIVLGAPVSTWSIKQRKRRTGETLLPREIRWLPLDLDGIDIGPHDPRTDDVQIVSRRVLEKVGLADMSPYDCVFSYTARAGTPKAGGKVRCRMWFHLEKPVQIEQLRAWSEQYPGIDSSIIHPVQPIYTAAPQMTRNGKDIPDILPQRVFLLRRGGEK